MMLLSVHQPHSGRDEVGYTEALEVVRATLVEGKRMGAVEFFIGGDLNIELKLCLADDEHRALDSIEWYKMYGPACEGTADDIIAYEKKIEMEPVIERLHLHCDRRLDEQRGQL